MTEPLIGLTRQDDIGIVIINRPQKLNSITPEMLNLLEATVRALDADTTVRVVILTGAGSKAFCVGADINEWAALTALDMWRRWVKRGHQVFDQIAQLRQPVIAAINGHAMGGGLELAVTADIRISSANALFALPETSIATCPGWSGSQRLVKLIGASHSKYLALTGQSLDTQQALKCGLVHEMVASSALMERAMELARHMATKAPVAMQLTKQLINAATDENAAATLEAMAGALTAATHDAAEGIASFREKRPANFLGQ